MENTNTQNWYLERVLFLIAGSVSLIGLLVANFLSPWGLLLNLLVGVNMILFSVTGFCPMGFVLTRLGVPNKCGSDR
ncbi:YgaP-like transmembrane domain [Leptospira venezuelensis]|uniref:YgaP-like transmembrane domain n=1 Tax=Leptospira venezuelensis TaxID=1958811 RepID=UPI000A38B105|nr:YgaP-like transmembrane domain [Leptospira venezuelensis]